MNKSIVLILTLMMSARAMTLAYIGSTGSDTAGAPPAAWLMPLLGDAVIGISALWIAYLLLKKTGLWVWTTIVVWNVLSIWDSLSAYIISITAPWPDFFMLQTFGSSMFFMAAAMNVVILLIVCQKECQDRFLG